jgi:hypothetical protein
LESLHVQREFPTGVSLREVRHVGVYDAWGHGIDPNSAWAKRCRKVFDQSVDRSLGRRISRQRANHRTCAERRNEDNATAISQNRKRLLNEKERRADVYREEAVEILNGRIFDVRRLRHARIRNENVQPVASDIANMPGQVVSPVWSGKIRRYRLSPAATLANLGDDRVRFGFAAAIAMEATGRSSLEEGGAAASHCLCFALNARPSGLAGLRFGRGPQQHGNELVAKKNRDTSNEVTKGTFLKRLDSQGLPLTSSTGDSTMADHVDS